MATQVVFPDTQCRITVAYVPTKPAALLTNSLYYLCIQNIVVGELAGLVIELEFNYSHSAIISIPAGIIFRIYQAVSNLYKAVNHFANHVIILMNRKKALIYNK